MIEVNWHKGWLPISDSADNARLTKELKREVENNPNHVLFGKRIEFLAKWIGTREKDFIILVGENAYFTVHLTYNLEHDPNWPSTVFVGDCTKLQEFVDRFPDDPSK